MKGMLYFCLRKVNLKLVSLVPLEPTTEKILVIFPGALGDFICFLLALRKLAGVGEVDLLARAEYGDLLPANVTARSLERYEIRQLFVPGAEEDERLKRFFGRYVSVYSWMGSGQDDFIARLRSLCGGKLRVFSFRPAGSRTHIADYFLSCVGQGRSSASLPLVPTQSRASAWSRGFWRRNCLDGRKVLAISPGSGAREKNWPPRFYSEVVWWWEKEVGGESVVIWGPVEEERIESESHWGRARVVRGLDLAQLATLISRCDLYLGNDSGVTHLAAALGVETVAIFGPTDARQWAPRGRKVTVVTQQVDCSPCPTAVMKSCPHRKCLTALGSGEVITRLGKLLRRGALGATLLDKVEGRD